MTNAVGVGALADLSKARRRHFVEKIDIINAIYKAYIVGAALLIAGSFLVGLVQSAPLGSSAQKALVNDGPLYIGLLFALAIFLGLRSGSRGGPLALQGADVRMILLSGVPRSKFLRSKALSQVRSIALPTLLIGGLIGGVAHRALEAGTLPLVVEGALIAFFLSLVLFGSGYLASGLRLNKWLASLVGVIILLVPAYGIWKNSLIFPGAWLGEVFFNQSKVSNSLLAAAIAVVIFVFGLFFVDRLSLEMLERRARLVGTLRFAATTRDIRTVILLRRQLSGERPRSGRTFLSSLDIGNGMTAVVAKRAIASIERWPVERYIRFLVLAVVAGVSTRMMWSGSFLPLGVAIVALFVAATDLLEPLSQMADRPEAVSGIGVKVSKVESRLLLVPFIGMIVFVLLGTLATSAFSGFGVSLHIGLISAIPIAAASTTGAAVAILKKQGSATASVLMPEVVALTSVIVEIIPFVIVACGFVPLVDSYNLHSYNTGLIDVTAISAASFSLLIPLGAWTWIRRRNEFSPSKL